MLRGNTVFVCQKCGAVSLKWQGKCFQCGAWGSLVERVLEGGKSSKTQRLKKVQIPKIYPLEKVPIEEFRRLETEILEFDRVLGGGFVPGSVILLAGEPGIGKSTLLLQVVSAITAHKDKKNKTLYVSGEESTGQIKLRASRLTLFTENLFVIFETDVDQLLAVIESQLKELKLVIIDSIQTCFTQDLSSPASSISQVQECTRRLTHLVKDNGIVLVLVGHVTKSGNIAGPKSLEHIVDVVLSLEGDRVSDLRVLRAIKNRFGSLNEVGLFRMEDKGLSEVSNLSEELLYGRQKDVSGSVVTVVVEGLRPLLLEIQALTAPGSFGVPRRVANGISFSRLAMLLAVLKKRAGLNFGQQDVYVNVSGGVKIVEPAVDLAVCLALGSSIRDRILPENLVAWGEVGLLGEVKPVGRKKIRIMEARKLGFSTVISADEVKTVRKAFEKIGLI